MTDTVRLYLSPAHKEKGRKYATDCVYLFSSHPLHNWYVPRYWRTADIALDKNSPDYLERAYPLLIMDLLSPRRRLESLPSEDDREDDLKKDAVARFVVRGD